MIKTLLHMMLCGHRYLTLFLVGSLTLIDALFWRSRWVGVAPIWDLSFSCALQVFSLDVQGENLRSDLLLVLPCTDNTYWRHYKMFGLPPRWKMWSLIGQRWRWCIVPFLDASLLENLFRSQGIIFVVVWVQLLWVGDHCGRSFIFFIVYLFIACVHHQCLLYLEIMSVHGLRVIGIF
jgi:hypothetical protein